MSLPGTATTKIYTLSLHDALPILAMETFERMLWNLLLGPVGDAKRVLGVRPDVQQSHRWRSEEHTSELQSQSKLVCRLLLEKKTTARGAPRSARSCAPRARRRGRR